MNEPDRSSQSPRAARGWLPWLGDLLTRDYCPRYNRYVKWVGNPTAILIVATVASALCGVCLHPRAFAISIGLGALLAAGVAWPWLGLLGLGGTLCFEKSRAREGEPVKARLPLLNRCPWAAWGLSVHAGLHERADAGLSHAGGWKRTEMSWDFTPDRRGVYPGGVPKIASGFPFGLSSSSRALDVSGSLLVWPRTFDVGPIPRVTGGLSSMGTAPRDRPGDSGDFLGVRAYRRGDSLRRVHWPQTARLGQMVVCELQSDAVPRVQVVLDADPAWHVGEGPDGSREWAIRVAASFLESWTAQGAEVELVVDGRAIPAGGGPVAGRVGRMLDVLARVGPGVAMPLPELLELPACRRFSAGLRMIVATDLAVSRLLARPSGGACDRFAVLRGAGFDPSGATAVALALPVRPWAWIDDPARVAQQVRRAWKEVVLEN